MSHETYQPKLNEHSLVLLQSGSRHWSKEDWLVKKISDFYIQIVSRILPQQSFGVRVAVSRVISIDVVTAVAENLLTFMHLCWFGPGLCILAGHASYPHHGHACAPNQNKRHLQQHLELGFNRALQTSKRDVQKG